MRNCVFGCLAKTENGAENGVGNNMMRKTVFRRDFGRENDDFGVVFGMFLRCKRGSVKVKVFGACANNPDPARPKSSRIEKLSFWEQID